MALSALGKTSVEVEEAVQRQKLFVRKLTLDDDEVEEIDEEEEANLVPGLTCIVVPKCSKEGILFVRLSEMI